MKLSNIFSTLLCPAAVAFAAIAATGCSEEITVSAPDTGNYEVPSENKEVIYVADKDGKREFSNVEFRSNGSTSLRLFTPGNVSADCQVKFTYDPTALEEYNAANGSDYKIYPEELVTIGDNNGVVTIPAGTSRSSEIAVTIVSNGEMDHETSYVIPLRASVISAGDYVLGNLDNTRLIFVKDRTAAPDATKLGPDGLPGVRMVSIIESNDTNPLNHLSFTLGDTGIPFFDVVVLFSGNIRFNRDTQKIYVHLNENLTPQLNNAEKYIRPLQNKGIKVVLSILGDHDGSGLANLTEQGAKQFAQALRETCDRYGLDGVMFDDEYSEYTKYRLQDDYPDIFCKESNLAGARLCYYTKKAMPDKLMTLYRLGNLNRFDKEDLMIDGTKVLPGEYLDMVFEDYGRGMRQEYFKGVSKADWAIYSQEFAQGRYASTSDLNELVNNGHKLHMVFALDPHRDTFKGNLTALGRCASSFYGSTCNYSGVIYDKDWK